MKQKNFALIGAAGYVAPKHMQAIKDTNNKLIVALDKNDSVGILDKYFYDVSFFTEFERLDRYAEKLRRKSEEERIHYVSICSPNYLHDSHIRFALRIQADAICEKPLVLNPWNLDALQALETESGKKIFNVLQLRLHPVIIELKEKVNREYSGKKYNIDLQYVTSRGKWYLISWKGDISKSGGIATNIGIHFFDMLLWIFGHKVNSKVTVNEPTRMSGELELEKANIKWSLSINVDDLPDIAKQNGKTTYRSLKINGEDFEFSKGFIDLHTAVYKDILSGKGFKIDDARASIELAHEMRNCKY
jgi:UDP-N-acetyl-2-amino-2-deoxyglucuronate dehydrogenase